MVRKTKQIVEDPIVEDVVETSDQPGEVVETPTVAVRAKRVYKKRVKKVIEEVTSDTEPQVKTSIKSLTIVPRRKREPSKYNLFVREYMTKQSIKDLPPKQRFSAVSKAWKESKL